MVTVFSTADLPPTDRLPYWVDAVCDTYVQLDCEAATAPAPFRGEIVLHTLSTLGLSRVTADAQHVRRTSRGIRRAAEDSFLVSVQIAGTGAVVQDDRVARLHPGDFALYDSTRPYELLFDGPFSQYVLQLPGPLLRSRLRGAGALTARAISGTRGAGHLLVEMIRTLAADAETLEPESAEAVAQSVEHVLLAGLQTLPGAVGAPSDQPAAEHRARVRAHVVAHLRDPLLSVASIAAALHLSPSTVHRAFSEEPCSITEEIRIRRLDGLRRDLTDPALAHRTVAALAASWGLIDPAHLSRTFRAHFGRSPRELRSNSLSR